MTAPSIIFKKGLDSEAAEKNIRIEPSFTFVLTWAQLQTCQANSSGSPFPLPALEDFSAKQTVFQSPLEF